MKRFFLLMLIFVSGCGQFKGAVVFDEMDLYKDESMGEEYYFSYPVGAEVNDNSYFVYEDCKVYFGLVVPMRSNEAGYDIRHHKQNDVSYRALYKDNVLQYYYASPEDSLLYSFAVYDEEAGVSQCVELVNAVAESFTSKPIYYNDKFGFKINLSPDFKVENLPSGEGVLMKKRIESEECEMEELKEFGGKDYECPGYDVEIYVLAYENTMGYENVADLVAKKYSGYTADFVEHPGASGISIDEGSGDDAIRRFFMMNDDVSIIYEAYLKVPSFYYMRHKQGFDDLIKTFSY